MNPYKALRKAKGISQAELGEKLHVTQMSVSAWETGRSTPDVKTIVALADMYGVSTDYLLGRTDNPLSVVPRDTPYLEVAPFEKEIIMVYRSLPAGEQALICRSLGLLYPADVRAKIKKVSQ